jgi:hypothetical protein
MHPDGASNCDKKQTNGPVGWGRAARLHLHDVAPVDFSVTNKTSPIRKARLRFVSSPVLGRQSRIAH